MTFSAQQSLVLLISHCNDNDDDDDNDNDGDGDGDGNGNGDGDGEVQKSTAYTWLDCCCFNAAQTVLTPPAPRNGGSFLQQHGDGDGDGDSDSDRDGDGDGDSDSDRDGDGDGDDDDDGDGDGDNDNELLYMLLKEFMCFHVALIIYCLFFSFHANSSSPVQVSVMCACVSVMCHVCVSASVICHVRLCHCHVCVSVSVMFVSVSVISLGLSVHQTVNKLCIFHCVM